MGDLCSQVLEEVQRAILAIARDSVPPGPVPGGRDARGAIAPEPRARRLLDVGCWDGAATLRYAEAVRAAPLGIEIFEAPAATARARGVEVAAIDLECGRFPWDDASIDLVLANQVFEHLKNPWRPMSEMFRVLAPGGTLVISVPNLASLHNRALLGMGVQPTSIRTLGPHVRGFTAREIRNFVALGGALEAVHVRGVGFYPLPARRAGLLAALWPGASHTVIVTAVKKTTPSANPWRQVFESQEFSSLQTYFG